MAIDTNEREVRATRLHPPVPRHLSTVHVAMDADLCIGCGACSAACPRHVLGVVSVLGHTHAHVDNAAACTGCFACGRVCPAKAISRKAQVQKAG
jgi:2-oxoglutarate ferredoxin oxidoreductase subunit delta